MITVKTADQSMAIEVDPAARTVTARVADPAARLQLVLTGAAEPDAATDAYLRALDAELTAGRPVGGGDLGALHVQNMPGRLKTALSYYTGRLQRIAAWLATSRETTNFTYALTDTNMEYLAHFVAVVTGVDRSAALGFIREPLTDGRLIGHLREKTAAHPRVWCADIEPRFGRRLGWYAMVRAMKPRCVVETGVDKGLGSVLLCAALERNAAEGRPGAYFGTDINPQAGYLLDGPYAAHGRILYGDSIDSLTRFDRPIDLFINDSDHSGDYELREYRTVAGKLAPEAVVLGDNSHVTPSLVRFAEETGRRFLFFREEPRDHWYPGGGIGFAY